MQRNPEAHNTMSRRRKSQSPHFRHEDENISKIFTPRNYWVKDLDTQNCFNCDKQFILLILRKHHCRMCGHIFCSK